MLFYDIQRYKEINISEREIIINNIINNMKSINIKMKMSELIKHFF